jgi:hypothetical protein
LGKEERTFLDVQLFALSEAESEKAVVRSLSREELNDLHRAPAQDRIAAQGRGLQPARGRKTVGQNLGANRLVNARIFVGEQVHKSFLLRITRFHRAFWETDRAHQLFDSTYW